jgi:hypothetical protein
MMGLGPVSNALGVLLSFQHLLGPDELEKRVTQKGL